MSLYVSYLKVKVALKRLGISLHLTHPPHLGWTYSPLTKGVNARYHGANDGYLGLARSAVQSSEQLVQLLGDKRLTGSTIALIEKMDLDVVEAIAGVAKFNHPDLLAVELGNEIDLTGATPQQFNEFLGRGISILRSKGYNGDIITGGISRVRPDTIEWLRKSLVHIPTGADTLIGIHRYSVNNDATIPQDGYVNRDEECQAIKELTWRTSLAITEFGYPLLDGSTQADYDKVVSSIKTDLDYFSRMGVKYAMYYQWLNGPTNTPIDRFGIKDHLDIQGLLR